MHQASPLTLFDFHSMINIGNAACVLLSDKANYGQEAVAMILACKSFRGLTVSTHAIPTLTIGHCLQKNRRPQLKCHQGYSNTLQG